MAYLISIYTTLFSLHALLLPVLSSGPYSKSVNDFGSEIQSRLGGNSNLFISPISIYLAMSMTYLGARGETREQLEKGLKMRYHELSALELHFNSLIFSDLYSESNPNYTLSTANGLFIQDGFKYKNSFLQGLKRIYKATAKTVDFARNGENAKAVVNEWVAEKTQNKIENFLGSPLDPTTVLALLNAIYFKGTWKTQFNPNNTQLGSFYKANNAIKQVNLMHLNKASFNYYEDAETAYKFLQMPYEGNHISMFLALPMRDEQFPDLEMTNEIMHRITKNVQKRHLNRVVIPKFHFEYESELKEALKAMGVEDLFDSKADLADISESTDLQVSSVIHKAVIDVNEEGSEAAAVSGVIITVKSAFAGPEFVANRPFLFYILDKRFNIVLFSGRVADP